MESYKSLKAREAKYILFAMSEKVIEKGVRICGGLLCLSIYSTFDYLNHLAYDIEIYQVPCLNRWLHGSITGLKICILPT